ncbi:MAG: alginate lyase family protein [Chloroflexi bacterium]|nr:alginate lyase family protein [Chloroflexota bacterium]
MYNKFMGRNRLHIHRLFVALALISLALSGCSEPARDKQAQELAGLRSQIAGQEQTIEDLRKANEANESEINELNAKLVAAQAQASQQATIIAELRSKLEAAQLLSAEQSKRMAELEAMAARTGVKSFNHKGVFYDSENVTRVKNNLSTEPWRAAFERLKLMADGYLNFTPSPIRSRFSVPSPYDDPTVQDTAVKPLEDSSSAMLTLAQYYLFTGDTKYAQRAVAIANAWTGSLMELENPQALWEAGWETLVMSMAAHMLRDYDGWNQEARKGFEDWLNERTWHILARDNSANNHQYWIAAQAASVGVLTGDTGLFQWAVAVYKKAVANDIQPDGHLPQETARAELGMFYQNFALEPLVLVAEIATGQGLDLWSYSYQGKDLKLAIDYLFGFFDQPEKWPWSKRAQDLTFLDPALGGKKTGWFEIAYYHYREPEIGEYLLEERPVFSRRAGGMTTLTHGLALN